MHCWFIGSEKKNFDDILKVKSFLYTVTRNKCLNHLKHEQLDIPDFPEQEKFDSGFEAAIIEQETFRIVRKAVEELPTQMQKYHLIFHERVKKP